MFSSANKVNVPPAEMLWEALSEDQGIELVLLDHDLHVTFINRAFRRSLSLGDLSLPASLRDVFGTSVGAILTNAAQQALGSKEQQSVLLTIRGHATRATIRVYKAGAMISIARSMKPIDVDLEAKPLPGDLGRLDSLTPREAEVLGYIGEGYTSAEIAKRLNRSIKTIEWHRVSIGQKLQTTSRVALALVAQQAGLSKVISTACPLPPE